ncbi:MAG: helix-turn-helix domain-containing protein [Clostridia bacterium]|nr:helix-turn-helix domain-containing protein [Clostridia bacterium]
MKSEHDLLQGEITVHSIVTVNAIRNKGFRHSYRNGRLNHGFVYVVRGSLSERFWNGEEIILTEGNVLFVPKGCRYEGVYLEDGTEVKIIQFDLKDKTAPPYLSQPITNPLPNPSEWLEPFFSRERTKGSGHPLYQLSCMYRLLWQMSETFFGIPARYRRLQPALDEMNAHFTEAGDTVGHWAEMCEMSEVNFRRVFREYTGQSPIDYRNQLRLNRARILLQSGEYNVSEAAEACGFSNLSFFIRLYKKHFGHTPKKE